MALSVLAGLINSATPNSGNKFSDQSYKRFMLVNYDSRVLILGIFKSGMTLES